MKSKEVEKFFSEILGRTEYICYEADVMLPCNGSYVFNMFPVCFYKILRNESIIRMSKILQNGNNIYVFNTSNHTRLEHSKGVYTKTLDVLMRIYKDEKLRKFVKSKGYYKYFVALLAKALLHDIGHGPFSHTMETVCNLPKGFHEEIGKRIISENNDLKEALNEIYNGLPELINEVTEKNFLGLNRLFEGEFDVDRGDFLSRDIAFVHGHDYAAKYIKITSELFQNFYIGKVVNKDGKHILSPIFKRSQLENVEVFLKQRFNNYRNIYYHPKSMAYEHIFKEFAKVLIERGEDSELKNFLVDNVSKKPDEINLDEYLDFNDAKYLSEIFKIGINTNDSELKALAALCIPNKDMINYLYYGLMVSYEQSVGIDGELILSDEYKKFVLNLAKIASPESELGKLLLEYPYEENCFVLESDLKSDVEKVESICEKVLRVKKEDFENIGLISWKMNINSYKGKKDECIYIEASDGNVYEYSIHPERKEEIIEFTKSGFFALAPKLRQAGFKDKDIMDVKKIISGYNKKLKKQ